MYTHTFTHNNYNHVIMANVPDCDIHVGTRYRHIYIHLHVRTSNGDDHYQQIGTSTINKHGDHYQAQSTLVYKQKNVVLLRLAENLFSFRDTPFLLRQSLHWNPPW